MYWGKADKASEYGAGDSTITSTSTSASTNSSKSVSPKARLPALLPSPGTSTKGDTIISEKDTGSAATSTCGHATATTGAGGCHIGVNGGDAATNATVVDSGDGGDTANGGGDATNATNAASGGDAAKGRVDDGGGDGGDHASSVESKEQDSPRDASTSARASAPTSCAKEMYEKAFVFARDAAAVFATISCDDLAGTSKYVRNDTFVC